MDPTILSQQLKNTQEYFARSTRCLVDDDESFAPAEGMMTVAQQVAHVALTIDWFFEGAEPRGRPAANPVISLDEQALRFAGHFASITSPTVRRQIEMLVKTLAKGGK